MAEKFLDKNGFTYFYNKLKAIINDTFQKKSPTQTQGSWKYRVYDDGTFEAWYGATGQTVEIGYASGTLYRSELLTLTLPTNLTSGKTVNIFSFVVGAGHNNYPIFTSIASKTGTQLKYYVLSGGKRASNSNNTITAYVMGTIL